jgi:hypothetical protein
MKLHDELGRPHMDNPAVNPETQAYTYLLTKKTANINIGFRQTQQFYTML